MGLEFGFFEEAFEAAVADIVETHATAETLGFVN